MVNRYKYQKGFTIIELLVVIIVIAILAAVVIIAYPQIIQRANESAVRAELSQDAKILALYKTDHNDLYPKKNNCPTPAENEICFKTSLNFDKFLYISSSDNKSYALKVVKSNATYYITSNSSDPIKDDTNNVILMPKTTINIDEQKEEEQITNYNNLYINPDPSVPTVDLRAFIYRYDNGNLNDPSDLFSYVIYANTAEKYVIFLELNNESGTLYLYYFSWSDKTAANIADIGTADVKKGWNKIILSSGWVIQSSTQINYNDLPIIVGPVFFLNIEQSTPNVETEAGKYINTEPYVYKFE